MSESFFSSIWYRIAGLRPRLASHVRISRHRYRGKGWYVVHDPLTGKVHRFTPASWLILGRLDGTRTVDEIWTDTVDKLGEEAPTQDEALRLLSQLYTADILRAEVAPDVAELLERFDRQARQKLKQRIINPMAIRIPLINPDDFLLRTLPVARLFIGWGGAIVWLLTMAAALVVLALNWPELTEGVVDRVLSAETFLMTWIAYPLVKALHELAHGWLARRYGVPVPEMGIMLLIFFPVPYVDVSAAAALPDKRQRALIAAGGILVELFLAALALIAWSMLEPGLLRSFAFTVMLVGGISSVFVNGNPLLRFDGYYVLSDLIEMPNLAQRATKFWGSLIERHVFRAEHPADEHGRWQERAWLLVYAPAAFVYRIFLALTIALIVASVAFGLGVLLAVWSLFVTLVLPALKSLRHVVVHPRLARVRSRAMWLTGAGVAAAVLLLFAAPAPMATHALGIVWMPEAARLRAGTDGFVTEILAPPGSTVTRGTPVIRTVEPILDTRIEIAEARLRGIDHELRVAQTRDRSEMRRLEAQRAQEAAALARERDEKARLEIFAGLAGTLVIPSAQDLDGRFVRRGEVLGYVVAPRIDTVRVAVAQSDIDLVREGLTAVEVLPVSGFAPRMTARIARQVPAADRTLPSAALSTRGGGRIALDPQGAGELATFERIFQLDLAVDGDLPVDAIESHVQVRFVHDWMPLGQQVWRRLRLLVLSRLNA